MATNDRDIDILLSLDTYQGMTDSEIESIINFKINAAFSSAEYEYIKDSIDSRFEAETAAYEAICARASRMLDELANATVVLRSVEYE